MSDNPTPKARRSPAMDRQRDEARLENGRLSRMVEKLGPPMNDDTPTPTADPPERGIPAEADWEAWPAVLQTVRDEIDKAVGRGRRWDQPTTMGEVAERCGTTPQEVHRLILLCGHLVDFIRDDSKPIEDWIVFEDGE